MLNSNKIVKTKVLPTNSSLPETKDMTFYTFCAQLTFGLPQSSDGANVTKYFRHWVFSSCESIDYFALIPFEDEKGQKNIPLTR
jgi:hypothetical protein